MEAAWFCGTVKKLLPERVQQTVPTDQRNHWLDGCIFDALRNERSQPFELRLGNILSAPIKDIEPKSAACRQPGLSRGARPDNNDQFAARQRPRDLFRKLDS